VFGSLGYGDYLLALVSDNSPKSRSEIAIHSLMEENLEAEYVGIITYGGLKLVKDDYSGRKVLTADSQHHVSVWKRSTSGSFKNPPLPNAPESERY
jgi:hypothetical protein